MTTQARLFTTRLIQAAVHAIQADAPNGVWHQHVFLCHAGNAHEHGDGCDQRADPRRVLALDAAADLLMLGAK